MKLVKDKISLQELAQMSEKMFGGLVKAVVDIEQEIMVVDAGMHVDEELFLLDEHESKQEFLWGINIYPDKYKKEGFVVFDSMINIRPNWGNRSRGVDDLKIQRKILDIVNKMVTP